MIIKGKKIHLIDCIHWDANLYAMDDLPATWQADEDNGIIVSAVLIRPLPGFEQWTGEGEVLVSAVHPDVGQRFDHRLDVRLGVDAYRRFCLLHESAGLEQVAAQLAVVHDKLSNGIDNPPGSWTATFQEWQEEVASTWYNFFTSILEPCRLRVPLEVKGHSFLSVACDGSDGQPITPVPVCVHLLGIHEHDIESRYREPRVGRLPKPEEASFSCELNPVAAK